MVKRTQLVTFFGALTESHVQTTLIKYDDPTDSDRVERKNLDRIDLQETGLKSDHI